MLTRALFLAAGWFTLSFIVTLLRGTRVRSGGKLRSLLWLVVVLLCGAVWAALTFGVVWEIIGLTLFTLVFGWWCIIRLPNWNALAQTLWATTVLTTVLYLAYSFTVTAFTPLHPLTFVASLSLTFVELMALVLGLTFAFESLDVCCRIRWNRRFGPLEPIPGYMPKVSLHVPAYNEPPDVVEATLRSLAQLRYPNFEVLLIDNNTPKESTWRPLEKVCQDLGTHFRFLHLDKWPGYKSGALNFALTQTAPDAEIIGIIDADYRVSPDFLSDLTPYFADASVAFVQTPQDYRHYQDNSYLEATYYGYKYFFAVSMPSRNERNAIIFAGTMGLIRRSALQEIGGWDEWCITEDAEASLRVLKRGYQSVYVGKAYGRGLMPYTFDGLKKQRFRWCFGGIQILKKHWEALMPWAHWVEPDNRLTMAQRYYYLFGGLQWFNEPLNLCFTIFLITGAISHLLPGGGLIRPLTGPLIVVPAIFLIVGMWRFLWVLRTSLHLSVKKTIRAMANFFSLGWTVTLACIQGLIQPEGVFMRTPKSRSASNFIRAIRGAQWETVIGLACVSLAIWVNVVQPRASTVLLGGLLVWQASLYLAAPYYSLYSIRSHEPRPLAHTRGAAVQESHAARLAIALALGLLVGVVGALLLPAVPAAPRYSSFQPPDIQVQQLVGLSPQPTFTPTLTPIPASPTVLPTSGLTFTPPVEQTAEASPLPPTTPSPPPTTPATTTPSPPSATPQLTGTLMPTATLPPTLPPATATPQPTATPAPATTLPPTLASQTVAAPVATSPAPTTPGSPSNTAPVTTAS